LAKGLAVFGLAEEQLESVNGRDEVTDFALVFAEVTHAPDLKRTAVRRVRLRVRGEELSEDAGSTGVDEPVRGRAEDFEERAEGFFALEEDGSFFFIFEDFVDPGKNVLDDVCVGNSSGCETQ